MKVEKVINWFITEGMSQAAHDLELMCIEVESMSVLNMQMFFETVYDTEDEAEYMFDEMLCDIEEIFEDLY